MHNAHHHSSPRLNREGDIVLGSPLSNALRPDQAEWAAGSRTKATSLWCLSSAPLGEPERGNHPGSGG